MSISLIFILYLNLQSIEKGDSLGTIVLISNSKNNN